MRNSKKRKQTTFFTDGKNTPVPIRVKKRNIDHGESSEPDFSKRVKRQHNNDPTYLECFNRSMQNFISTIILNKIRNSKRLENDLLKAKNELSNKRRLPAGIMTNAASFAGLELSVMRNFIDNNAEKLPIDLWKDYVEEHFDSIAKVLKENNLSFNKDLPSSSSVQPVQGATDIEEQYRTFSISVNKVFRKDLPDDIEKVVKEKLEASLENSSDFNARFLFILNSISIVFKNTAFIKNEDTVSIEKSTGFDILQVLPSEYIKKNDIKPKFSSFPLPHNMPDEYQKDLEGLFTDQHLSRIQSHFFGSRSQKQDAEKHPLESYIYKELASNEITRDSYTTSLSSEEMKVSLVRIITNVKNMWNTNKIFLKLLDHLLDVLLKLHLAGARVAKYNSYVNQKDKSNSVSKDPYISSNHRRNIISTEYKKKQKREKKLQTITDEERRSKYQDQILQNQKRIDFFKTLKKSKPTLNSTNKTEHVDETDSSTPSTNESSRSRLKALKSVAKHILLSYGETVIAEDINQELPDGTEQEKYVMNLIIQKLKPYIPDKKNRFIIGFQLPFCILANEILECSGYSKFTRLLLPQPHPSSLQTLELNATSLYQMLSAEPNPLSIADFDGKKIDSVDYARSNKDAVFCSIFNMNEIRKTCDHYKLNFSQNIKVQPGLKVCRILGSKRVKTNYDFIVKGPTNYSSQILNNPVVINESKKTTSDLKTEVDSLQQHINDLTSKLRALIKEDLITKICVEIKELKSGLTNDNKDETIYRKTKDCQG